MARRQARQEDEDEKGWERGTNEEEDEDHSEHDCGRELGEEETKYRIHQYQENIDHNK